MNKLGVQYEVHVENIGWMPPVKDGTIAGTIDQSLRIEAVRFTLINPDNLDVHLLGNSHVENLGWTGFVGENEICGTVGQSLKLQALRGADAGKYAVQARAENVQNIGEMDWVTGEDLVGTTGGNLRFEALEMMITDAGADLFISIHHNGSSDPSASGSCAICYPDSDDGFRLATSCLNGLYNRLGLRQIGLIQRDDSDVTYTDMPAVITEAMFASCSADCALFNNGGAELEALGILDGILAYLG